MKVSFLLYFSLAHFQGFKTGAGEQKVSFQLTTPSGQVILDQQVNSDQHLHRLVLPLRGYPAGVYLLRVNTLRETTTLKIIKQ